MKTEIFSETISLLARRLFLIGLLLHFCCFLLLHRTSILDRDEDKGPPCLNEHSGYGIAVLLLQKVPGIPGSCAKRGTPSTVLGSGRDVDGLCIVCRDICILRRYQHFRKCRVQMD